MRNRLPRVTAEEHAAFKLEIPKLRKELNDIRSERLKFLVQHNPQKVQQLQARQLLCRVKLTYWHNVLTVGRAIRSPVRLWDTWHKLDTIAWLNEFELDYLAEQLSLEPLAAQELARLNSWQFVAEPFLISTLTTDPKASNSNLFHRLLHFREHKPPHRAVAVASQPEGALLPKVICDRAAELGLRCHIPPTPTGSWQGRTGFCVFTRPEIARVQFLPEQETGGKFIVGQN